MPDKPIIMSDSITHCSYCDEQKPVNVECECSASRLARAERTIAHLEAQLADSQRLAGEQAQRAERAEARCREWNVEASRIGGLCGSEFHDDPEAVFARVRDMQDGRTRALKESAALRSQLAAAREALGKMRRYFWCTAEPGWGDLLMDVEDECWQLTRIAPPGRSEPVELSGRRSDDERRRNWQNWINAKRLAVLAEVDAALAAGKE